MKIFFQQKRKLKEVDGDGNEDITTISYKIKIIDSARFMTGSLSNLVDNFYKTIS